MNNTLTAVEGIKVGHWTDFEAQTGCTVVVCPEEGCVASGYALGNAPGSREYALLAPDKMLERINALVLTGGSAFGLDAATGVMQWLEQKEIGFSTPFAKVPIVPAAVIFDLIIGDPKVRPTAKSGFEAASKASSEEVSQGRVGVGAGALVGKYLGNDNAAFGGLGCAAIKVGEATVAAMVVSNAIGDIVQEGKWIAGSKAAKDKDPAELPNLFAVAGANTTLAVVATDATLTKAEAHALSKTAHIGIAQVTRPSHTIHDGDSSFVLSTCQKPAISIMALSIAVQQVVANAIVSGVKAANS